MMADSDFYVNEDASSDAIAEHAKLKQRLAAAEEEWFTLTEELEAEMARQHTGTALLQRPCSGAVYRPVSRPAGAGWGKGRNAGTFP